MSEEKTVWWQSCCRQAHQIVEAAMEENDLAEAVYWQEVGAGDYHAMWIRLSQLI